MNSQDTCRLCLKEVRELKCDTITEDLVSATVKKLCRCAPNINTDLMKEFSGSNSCAGDPRYASNVSSPAAIHDEVDTIKYEVEGTKICFAQTFLHARIPEIGFDCLTPYKTEYETTECSTDANSFKPAHIQYQELILNDPNEREHLLNQCPSIHPNTDDENKWNLRCVIDGAMSDSSFSSSAMDFNKIDIIKRDIEETKEIKIEPSQYLNESDLGSLVTVKTESEESPNNKLSEDLVTASTENNVANLNGLKKLSSCKKLNENAGIPEGKLPINPKELYSNQEFISQNIKMRNESNLSSEHTEKSIFIESIEKPKKVCRTQKQLKSERIVNSTDNKLYQCKMCSYKSFSQRKLNTHTKRQHSEQSFTCEICNIKIARKHCLVRHMQIHTGEKHYKCEICDCKFTRKGHLLSHKSKHTGEKAFKCDICGYKAAYKSNFVLHMRTHTGEKPFKCEICEHKYASKDNLISHMRKHTGEKPFKCGICDYKSAYKGNLVKHMRKHTDGKL